MAMLIMLGEDCYSCEHNERPYGDCPFEPDARYSKPNINGTKICHRHSKGPLSR